MTDLYQLFFAHVGVLHRWCWEEKLMQDLLLQKRHCEHSEAISAPASISADVKF